MKRSEVGITLDGVMAWQLLEGEEVTRQGKQHNLLLDSGLDNIGTYGLINPYKYACVGTGTSEPAVTQTALDAEVARTNVRPSGYSDSPTYQSPGVYTLEIVREFSEASIANKNLTEWGFSPVSSGGVGVRERFRDDDGNPVTLTPDGTQKLRLTYGVTVALGPVTPTAAGVTVAGAGAATPSGADTLTGAYTLVSISANNGFDFILIDSVLRGSSTVRLNTCDDPSPLGYTESYDTSMSERPTTSPVPYAVGSFERAFGSATVSAQAYTGRIKQVTFGYNTIYTWVGYAFEFNSQDIITKDDLHTLTIEGPLISWGRA